MTTRMIPTYKSTPWCHSFGQEYHRTMRIRPLHQRMMRITQPLHHRPPLRTLICALSRTKHCSLRRNRVAREREREEGGNNSEGAGSTEDTEDDDTSEKGQVILAHARSILFANQNVPYHTKTDYQKTIREPLTISLYIPIVWSPLYHRI